MGYYNNLTIGAEENPAYLKAQDDLMDSIVLNHHLMNVLAGLDKLSPQERAEVQVMQESYSHDQLTSEEQEQLNIWIDTADKGVGDE